MNTTRIWDLPTRLFHWLLALSIVGLIITGNVGGNAMTWHFRLGYLVLSLLIFRLIWGVVGGYWSRFIRFIYSPMHTVRYVLGQHAPSDDVGHSPTGALSVFAILGVVLAQVLSGLVSDDEIATTGPWIAWVSSETSSMATQYHTEIGKLILLGLIVLHVLALIVYRIKGKRDLVPAMVSGNKRLSTHVPRSRDDVVSRLAGLLVMALSGAMTYVLVSVLPAA